MIYPRDENVDKIVQDLGTAGRRTFPGDPTICRSLLKWYNGLVNCVYHMGAINSSRRSKKGSPGHFFYLSLSS